MCSAAVPVWDWRQRSAEALSRYSVTRHRYCDLVGSPSMRLTPRVLHSLAQLVDPASVSMSQSGTRGRRRDGPCRRVATRSGCRSGQVVPRRFGTATCPSLGGADAEGRSRCKEYPNYQSQFCHRPSLGLPMSPRRISGDQPNEGHLHRVEILIGSYW